MTEVIFKDGSVGPAKFGRVVEFDERSKNFPIRKTIKEKKRRSYTWRCNLHLDQKPYGSCVAASFLAELAARPSEVSHDILTYDYMVDTYFQMQEIDEWPGGAAPKMTPYYEGTSVLAGAKIMKKLGWCEEYRWGFGENDLAMGVGYRGPAVIGIDWYSSMMTTDAKGFIKPGGKWIGKHAILVKAYNYKLDVYTLHNSWGEGWGKFGDCCIKGKDLAALLGRQGEVLFLMKRHKKAQPE